MPAITTRFAATVQTTPFSVFLTPWSVRAYLRWNALLNIYLSSPL